MKVFNKLLSSALLGASIFSDSQHVSADEPMPKEKKVQNDKERPVKPAEFVDSFEYIDFNQKEKLKILNSPDIKPAQIRKELEKLKQFYGENIPYYYSYYGNKENKLKGEKVYQDIVTSAKPELQKLFTKLLKNIADGDQASKDDFVESLSILKQIIPTWAGNQSIDEILDAKNLSAVFFNETLTILRDDEKSIEAITQAGFMLLELNKHDNSYTEKFVNWLKIQSNHILNNKENNTKSRLRKLLILEDAINQIITDCNAHLPDHDKEQRAS